MDYFRYFVAIVNIICLLKIKFLMVNECLLSLPLDEKFDCSTPIREIPANAIS